MSRGMSLIALGLFAFGAAEARAEKLKWNGTLHMELGSLASLSFRGSGVATVNGSGGGNQLTRLRLAGGITGSATIPVTDPGITGTLPRIRVTPRLGTGTLSPFWPVAPWPDPQLEVSALPIRGAVLLCTFDPSCASALVLPLSKNGGQTGVGVGGLLTVGGFGAFRISIAANPWTVFTADLTLDTIGGGTTVVHETGWIHGPASFSTTVARPGGALQLVTPLEIRGNTGLYLPGFSELTLEFVPEPSAVWLLIAGIVALVWLGSGGPGCPPQKTWSVFHDARARKRAFLHSPAISRWSATDSAE